MRLSHQILIPAVIAAFSALSANACAQIAVPPTAATSGRVISPEDSAMRSNMAAPVAADAPVTLYADLGARLLTVQAGDQKVKTFAVSIGQPKYPTPPGSYQIRKIIWNPSWRPPPDSKWAQGKTAKGPGDPGNPMKVVKIFFKEPDYYIHGTGDVESLGGAESHGCLRMAPDDVAELAKFIMEHGGQPHDENWFWRIMHFRREEKVVYLDNPISLTVSD
jgi:lipoprotein-anchoring transpeptidase ErfK/SrfK